MSNINPAVNGLQLNARKFHDHAQNIVQHGIQSRNPATTEPDAALLPQDVLAIQDQPIALEKEVVGMITAQHGYTVNAKMLVMQQEMDKALLDIFT